MHDAKIINSIGKDIKTDADLAANEHIHNELTKTGIKVISEESENKSFNINENQWIVDPIDGTLNFSRGFGMAAVSISLWDNGFPLLGVVNNIFYDELFYSSSNNGSFRNDKRINVSSISKASNAIICTGFPISTNYSNNHLYNSIMKVKKYKRIRMLGSASLMLSYVACGMFDIYIEDNIYIWDVAAGLSLINEAKGRYFITQGNSVLTFDVKASNSLLDIGC